jgi:hypothetical protein
VKREFDFYERNEDVGRYPEALAYLAEKRQLIRCVRGSCVHRFGQEQPLEQMFHSIPKVGSGVDGQSAVGGSSACSRSLGPSEEGAHPGDFPLSQSPAPMPSRRLRGGATRSRAGALTNAAAAALTDVAQDASCA